jgi:hypothetical protein
LTKKIERFENFKILDTIVTERLSFHDLIMETLIRYLAKPLSVDEIISQTCASWNSAEKGVHERCNQTLFEMVRSTITLSLLLLYRIIKKKNLKLLKYRQNSIEMSTYVIWFGIKPNVSFLKYLWI